MCAVRNMMWVGTVSGEIKIFHASTLQVLYVCTLCDEKVQTDLNLKILAIIYIAKTRTVLISASSGKIWSFFDAIVNDCLRIQQKLKFNSPCHALSQVCKQYCNICIVSELEQKYIV